jgi:diguanylate cyclase (GGDEF)-like protein
MPSEASPDVAFAGRRLKRKVLLALALSSVLPLLVLAYVVHGFVLPALRSSETEAFYGLTALLLSTMLAMIGGGYIIWDLGQTVARMAELMGNQTNVSGLVTRSDEVGTLMKSFSSMLTTIEQQTTDINSFATRLDSAYKELEATNAKLKETSFKDDVTGLYNRRFFTLRFEEEISRFRRFNHPVSVVVLDLDGFKSVNDELGHAGGDETLREVAQILMTHSRGINVVSRYGGDEFVILLVETSKAGARLYADRIRQVIATHPFPHGKPVTASFGVASLPDDELTPSTATSDDLFRAADEALYTAKRAGKNQVVAAGQPTERVG